MKSPKFECAFTFTCVDKGAALKLADWLSQRGLNPVRVNFVVAVDVDNPRIGRELLAEIVSTGWVEDGDLYEANTAYANTYNSWRDHGGEE